MVVLEVPVLVILEVPLIVRKMQMVNSLKTVVLLAVLTLSRRYKVDLFSTTN